ETRKDAVMLEPVRERFAGFTHLDGQLAVRLETWLDEANVDWDHGDTEAPYLARYGGEVSHTRFVRAPDTLVTATAPPTGANPNRRCAFEGVQTDVEEVSRWETRITADFGDGKVDLGVQDVDPYG